MAGRILSICCFSLFCTYLSGQSCGLTTEDQTQWLNRYLEHLADKDQKNTDSLCQVPIVLHLVARNNGVGRARISTALEVLCQLNTSFEPTNISFYLIENGFNLIDHDGIFNDSDLIINQAAMQNQKIDSALNVFVVNTLGNSTTVAYYDPGDDWIVIQKSAFQPTNMTLAHEIGHFFTLLHPHFGWDFQPYDPAIHGIPAPPIASNSFTPTELMDGSNCTTAADMLCDTPPDYNFGLDWQSDCDYQGGALDPNGTLVDPDETLIMSYFDDDCRDSFSPEQSTMMQLDLDDPARAYLHTSYTPSTAFLSAQPALLFPASSVSTSNDTITFEWEAVENAQFYYVEYDRLPTFNLDPKGLVTSENTLTISNQWLDGFTYYWRVYSWTDADYCLPPSDNESFMVEVVSSASSPAKPFNDISLQQIAGNSQLLYHLRESQNINLALYSIDGKLMYENNLQLPAGAGQQTLIVPEIASGVYLVKITGDFHKSQLIFLL